MSHEGGALMLIVRKVRSREVPSLILDTLLGSGRDGIWRQSCLIIRTTQSSA